jgi:hypothetical protein
MSIAIIIPLIGQLLSLSLRLAEVIEKSKGIDPKDKEALKALISKARDGVTYIDEPDKEGL